MNSANKHLLEVITFIGFCVSLLSGCVTEGQTDMESKHWAYSCRLIPAQLRVSIQSMRQATALTAWSLRLPRRLFLMVSPDLTLPCRR